MPNLYVVHCIDTEGPLKEPLEATFKRLNELYNIKLEASEKNLKLLQDKKIDLGGLEHDIARTFSQKLLAYNDTWEKIDQMLDSIMSKSFREKFRDHDGNGIIYNWHCLDNVGFNTNERFRDLGFGKVYNFYNKKIKDTKSLDKIHWHFHPLSFFKEAHICSTSYDNSYEILHQILSRRLINNQWFPVVNRAGFHAIRQDSNFFLEQWIPFDFSNQSLYLDDDSLSSDSNRYGNWSRAPKEWLPYNPSHEDYQSKGNMNRYTTKCLNVGTRFKLLTNYEIEMAFKIAEKKGSAILAFTNHDFRDMSVDIIDTYERIHSISKKFDSVKICNSDAVNAMQNAIEKKDNYENIELAINLDKNNSSTKIKVDTIKGSTFGSQPYLAIKTKDNRYFHDNFNEVDYGKSWEYILDRASINVNDIEKIVVASNDYYGNQSINKLNL